MMVESVSRKSIVRRPDHANEVPDTVAKKNPTISITTAATMPAINVS